MKTAEAVARELIIKLDGGFYPFNMEQKAIRALKDSK